MTTRVGIINGTIIYRELGDPPRDLITWLDLRHQLWNVLDDHQIEHLYVDNDQPRDSEITAQLIHYTIGFSLFTEGGKFISAYSRLERAVRAQLSAKLVVVPDVQLEDEIALDEDQEDTEPIGALEAKLIEQIESLKSQIAAGSESYPDEDSQPIKVEASTIAELSGDTMVSEGAPA